MKIRLSAVPEAKTALFPIKKVTHPADIFCPSVDFES